jgi:hypothetical protein
MLVLNIGNSPAGQLAARPGPIGWLVEQTKAGRLLQDAYLPGIVSFAVSGGTVILRRARARA